jgi:hypothetical protein
MDKTAPEIKRNGPGGFRAGSNPVAGLRAAALLSPLLFVACFHTPGWETEPTIPIVSCRFYAAEILDSTVFRVGPDSVMELYRKWDLDTIRLCDQVGTVEADDTMDTKLDDFLLTPVADVASGAALGDMAGITVPDSEYLAVPGFGYEFPLDCSLPGFEHAELKTGVLRVEVFNRTGVAMDTVRLQLPGAAPLNLGPLAPMSRTTARCLLDGITVDSILAVRFRFAGNGTGGESVWVHARDSALVNVTVDSLRLARGRIRLLAPTRMTASSQSESYLHASSRVRLDSVLVASGALDFTLSNTLPLPLDTRVMVPEVGFDSVIPLAARQQAGFSLDLAHRGYRNTDPDSSRLTLSSVINARPGGQTVDVESLQGLNVHLSGRTLTVDYVAGEAIDTVWSPTQESTLIINSPKELARMRFAHVWLQCSAASTIDFGAVVDLTATAYNPAGESAVVESRVAVAAGLPEQPAVSVADLDVARLLNIGPSRLVASGRAGVTGPGRAWFRSYVSGVVMVVAPLRVVLVADTFDFGPWTIAVDSAKVPGIAKDVTAGEITVHLVNHLPVAMSGELRAWSQTGEAASVALSVPQPGIDPTNGRVIATSDSVIKSMLDSIQCRVFTDTFQTRIRLFIPATDTITLTARDYLEIENSCARLTVETRPR